MTAEERQILESLKTARSTLAAMYRILFKLGQGSMSDTNNWVLDNIDASIRLMEKK